MPWLTCNQFSHFDFHQNNSEAYYTGLDGCIGFVTFVGLGLNIILLVTNAFFLIASVRLAYYIKSLFPMDVFYLHDGWRSLLMCEGSVGIWYFFQEEAIYHVWWSSMG